MSLHSSHNLSHEICFDNEILQSEVNSNKDVKKKKKEVNSKLSEPIFRNFCREKTSCRKMQIQIVSLGP